VNPTLGLKLAQPLVVLFLAGLHLQSGGAKALNWTVSRDELRIVFQGHPWILRLSGVLLAGVTVTELLTGSLCAAGLVLLLLGGGSGMALAGAVLGALLTLKLSIGQRLVRDWNGASALLGYFLLHVVATVLLGVE
jgi:hypothetical protein